LSILANAQWRAIAAPATRTWLAAPTRFGRARTSENPVAQDFPKPPIQPAPIPKPAGFARLQ
jgi:hypothetical protein